MSPRPRTITAMGEFPDGFDFASSDEHFGHRNIIGYCDRPFATVEEMDDALETLWNETVRPHHVVWVLGDVAMGRLEQSLSRIARLHGRKHLIAGNHDRCWPGGTRRSDAARQRYLDAGFESIVTHATTTLAGRHVEVSHFPYQGDSGAEDRYVEHRPVDRGAWLLHGHVHEKWRQQGRQLNVGVDAWDYRPVAAGTLAELIVAGPRDLDRYGHAQAAA